MKTQQEIEEKYEELNKQMSNALPTEESNKELASLKGPDALEKMVKISSNAISIDAQRFILEWVLGRR